MSYDRMNLVIKYQLNTRYIFMIIIMVLLILNLFNGIFKMTFFLQIYIYTMRMVKII